MRSRISSLQRSSFPRKVRPFGCGVVGQTAVKSGDARQNLELPDNVVVRRVRVDSAEVSPGMPVEMASASSSVVRPQRPVHLFGQTHESALRRLVCGARGRLSEQASELLVGVPELHAENDRLALFRAQPSQSALVALDLFHSDRQLERRACLVDLGPLQLSVRRSSPDAANLVANAVHHRLPEVGLQGPLPLGFEPINPVKRMEQGFLDKVLRVGQIARPPRQPALRPALKPGKVPREELVEPPCPATALDEVERGFRIAASGAASESGKLVRGLFVTVASFGGDSGQRPSADGSHRRRYAGSSGGTSAAASSDFVCGTDAGIVKRDEAWS
jgi:hypothetical protein